MSLRGTKQSPRNWEIASPSFDCVALRTARNDTGMLSNLESPNHHFLAILARRAGTSYYLEVINILAKKIQAWTKYGPRLKLGDPMTPEELIENIIASTNQSRGSVLAILSELDVQTEAGLKAGRIVKLPNGTHFEPVGKKDGSIDINVRVNPDLDKKVNALFRGKWLNPGNINKTEAEIIALWNEEHPDDPIVVEG